MSGKCQTQNGSHKMIICLSNHICVHLSLKDWLLTPHMYFMYLASLCCHHTHGNLMDGALCKPSKK